MHAAAITAGVRGAYITAGAAILGIAAHTRTRTATACSSCNTNPELSVAGELLTIKQAPAPPHAVCPCPHRQVDAIIDAGPNVVLRSLDAIGKSTGVTYSLERQHIQC